MEVLLLDALGTLVALEPPAPLLRRELAVRFGVRVSDASAQRAIAAEIEYYRAHLDEGFDATSLGALRERCAEALRSALPARPFELDLSELTDALLASLRFTAYPDVMPALSAARRRGLRLVVVSNWDISLHDRLRELGLTALVDGIVTSAEAGARKPAPAIFLKALGIAGVDAREAVHVGDSVDEDVAGARSAGIEPVLLSRGGGRPVAGVPTISSLSDLPL
jgi:putative hydrolase of the HAD superfamily